MTKASTTSPLAAARARRTAHLAEEERRHILHRDILGQREVHLYPVTETAAAEELSRFTTTIWNEPKMHGYFDRQHLVALRSFSGEARHGFATLASGGILEILVIPTMPDEVMGFHIFTVFDPMDDADKGRCIGYTIWSLEKGDVGFGRAEAVRMAFDIFPPFREGRYRKVPFTNHEVYNISRRLLYRFRPKRFLVDAKTQISQTRTGDRLHRMIYYLKRGYYPPDRKALADACLVRLTRGQRIGERSVEQLLQQTHAVFWVYPVAKYIKYPLAEAIEVAKTK